MDFLLVKVRKMLEKGEKERESRERERERGRWEAPGQHHSLALKMLLT